MRSGGKEARKTLAATLQAQNWIQTHRQYRPWCGGGGRRWEAAAKPLVPLAAKED